MCLYNQDDLMKNNKTPFTQSHNNKLLQSSKPEANKHKDRRRPAHAQGVLTQEGIGGG